MGVWARGKDPSEWSSFAGREEKPSHFLDRAVQKSDEELSSSTSSDSEEEGREEGRTEDRQPKKNLSFFRIPKVHRGKS
jgi:hypothetical protein